MSNYITISTKVKRKLVERTKRLGINISKFLRRKLEEERGEIKSNNQRLKNLKEILNIINIEKILNT